NLASANTLQNVVVGDLNGDGIPDIVVANNAGSTASTKITIYEGLGNGRYSTTPVVITPGNIQNIVGIALGHFSATGSAAYPDIAYIGNTGGFGGSYVAGFQRNTLAVPT